MKNDGIADLSWQELEVNALVAHAADIKARMSILGGVVEALGERLAAEVEDCGGCQRAQAALFAVSQALQAMASEILAAS